MNPRSPHHYRKFKKDACERCGFKGEARQLDVHHLDGNRSNNDQSNLQTLCANCHRLVHAKIGPTRSEVFQLRLHPSEKGELKRRADLQGVSVAELIRQRLNLDATQQAEAVTPDAFNQRVNELSRTMPRSNAERLAKKELG